MVRLSVDIGGTFTDIVLDVDGELSSIKILSSPLAPEQAAIEGLLRLLSSRRVPLQSVRTIIHGTTLATNALIERRGAKTAFVTTKGFRDVLEMRNEKRFEQYALNISLPEPLVPRDLRLPLDERILADGSVMRAPCHRDIGDIAQRLREREVEAVAVGFLHSYRNPSHEALVAERLRAALPPHVTVCQSAEVANEIREYDRFSTVCANAYVRPLMSHYLERLDNALREHGFSGALLLMLSGGGLTTVQQAAKTPIRLIESGPAGGVALAAKISREIGSNRTMSLDIGGTTAKICFIQDGKPQTSRRFEVARAWRNVKGSGLPVRVPTVEMIEIGAGGGSIAGVDALGRLSVGPQSAGSQPGPAAYNLGGEAATITDAQLTVGNIAADGFADGMIELAPERGAAAISSQVKEPLGLSSVEAAASGIIELADEAMANAARIHSIELGLDVREFDLLVSGGGGAVHGARIAEKLGIRRMIVPMNAGVGSAVGFLYTPVAYEMAISVMEPLAAVDPAGINQRVQKALLDILAIVEKAGSAGQVTRKGVAELRYSGHGLDLSIEFDLTAEMGRTLSGLAPKFTKKFKDLHGFSLGDIPIELIALSISASSNESRSDHTGTTESSDQSDETMRAVYDLQGDAKTHYRVRSRRSFGNGELLSGPAIVTEPQTTTLVRPGWSVTRQDNGHLILERTAS